MAWTLGTLEQLPTLYDPIVKFPLVLKVILDGIIILLKDKNYAQIRPDTPPFPGKLMPSKTTFAGQAGWQHTCGYFCGLGLGNGKYKPLMRDCKQRSEDQACPPCP